MRLENQTAIITGAASGMGAEEARVFASEGARVVVSDLDDALGQGVVDQIKQAGGEAHYIHIDVRRADEWAALVGQSIEKFGPIDILVNNAGLSSSFVQDDDDFEAWQRLMDVNLNGVYLGCRAVLPGMKAAGSGSIVNISSISGYVGSAGGHPGYFASKGGVRIYTKAMAFKHGPDGIRFNSVHPGVMPPMRSAAHFGATGPISPQLQRLLDMTPLKRRGETVDVAKAVLFVASDDAAFITGTELIVDGGMLCGYGGYPED
jgi:NAD(P)-dependent dehydrogenase (short-subunit alcohol dehydrogenase family)